MGVLMGGSDQAKPANRTPSLLPSDSEMEAGLRRLLGTDLEVDGRTLSSYSSTFAAEKVSARVGSQHLDLFCKHGSGYVDPVTGHRRGVDYEAEIYEQVLPGTPISTPRCHGTFETGVSHRCLVLDFVDGWRVNRTPNPVGLVWASGDVALLHADGVPETPPGLNRFDRSYFAAWAGRMASMGTGCEPGRGLIERLEGSLPLVIDILGAAPKTVIHGELYPDNVIIGEHGVVVVDWETTGIGPGVLDLAVLTLGHWDERLVEAAEQAYFRHSGLRDLDRVSVSLAAARVFAAAQLLCYLEEQGGDPDAKVEARMQIERQLRLLAP